MNPPLIVELAAVRLTVRQRHDPQPTPSAPCVVVNISLKKSKARNFR
jgi:hypothetical protein